MNGRHGRLWLNLYFANSFLKTDEVTRQKGSDFEGLITTAFILSLFYLKQQNKNVSIAGFLYALLCYFLDMITGIKKQLHDYVDHIDHDHGDSSAAGEMLFPGCASSAYWHHLLVL